MISSYQKLSVPIIQSKDEENVKEQQKTCTKIIIDIHRRVFSKIGHYVFREGRKSERAKIISQGINDIQYAFNHYSSIVS